MVILTWLDENSYKEVGGIKNDITRQFTSLLYASSPVAHQMGAFSLANLLQEV